MAKKKTIVGNCPYCKKCTIHKVKNQMYCLDISQFGGYVQVYKCNECGEKWCMEAPMIRRR